MLTRKQVSTLRFAGNIIKGMQELWSSFFRYATTKTFYTSYLSVPAKHLALVENFVPFVVKHQFSKTRIFLIEKIIEIIFQLSKHCRKF